jgi:hypothetical protein
LFNTAAGSWVAAPTATSLAGVAVGPYFQIKASMSVLAGLGTPPQLEDFVYAVNTPGENSDYWMGSLENSTQSGASPMYVSFMLTKAYSPLTTKFVIRGWDTSGNVITTLDTSIAPSAFYQSNNNGTSWAAWTNMAAFYNTPLTTELRVTVATRPAPVDNKIIWSISEN